MSLRFARLSNSFVLVLVLIQLLLIAMSISFTTVARRFLIQEEFNKAGIISKHVRDRIDENKFRGAASLSAIVLNPEIITAFRDKDRAKLLAATQPLWNELKTKGFAQFQFNHAEPSVVFLRLHSPEKFGDDFAAYRPTLVKAIATGRPVAGLEQGHSGYGFRSVIPAIVDGKTIGAIELGADFGQLFLQEMSRTFPGGWGIYNLQRGVRVMDDTNLVASIGDDAENFPNLPLPDDILGKLKADTDQVQLDSGREIVSVYVPIRNFQGDVAIVIKHVYGAAFYAKLRQMIIIAIIICSFGLIASLAIIFILYRQITVPLKKLAIETEKIQNFNLDEPVKIKAQLQEIRALIEATSKMKVGLQSFRKYVPAELVRQLIETHQEARIHGERRELAIMFTDIADFTTISENISPRELTAQLSMYLDEMTKIITHHQGTVDKYIGDAVMAFWGAPIAMQDHVTKSCLAAIDCLTKARELSARWKLEGKYEFRTRIGVNVGDVIVGNIGSEQRMSYTVIGDAVNLASRLEGLNKNYGTEILISEAAYNAVKNTMIARPLDFVLAKGKNEPTNIFELIGDKDDVSATDLLFYRDFERAMQAYRDKLWENSIAQFEALASRKPGDKPCEIFLARARHFLENPSASLSPVDRRR